MTASSARSASTVLIAEDDAYDQRLMCVVVISKSVAPGGYPQRVRRRR
jgi:hypothetical protein